MFACVFACVCACLCGWKQRAGPFLFGKLRTRPTKRPGRNRTFPVVAETFCECARENATRKSKPHPPTIWCLSLLTKRKQKSKRQREKKKKRQEEDKESGGAQTTTTAQRSVWCESHEHLEKAISDTTTVTLEPLLGPNTNTTNNNNNNKVHLRLYWCLRELESHKHTHTQAHISKHKQAHSCSRAKAQACPGQREPPHHRL